MFAEAVPPALHAVGRARHLYACLVAAGREDLLGQSLAPGMFDCRTQLEMVGDFAIRATYGLAGLSDPAGLDLEDPTVGLDEKLATVAACLEALTPAEFHGAAEREITHEAGNATLTQSGADYLRLFALPNLWFHLSMAYAILRSGGVDVGKADYDGWHSYPPGFRFDA